MVLGLSHPRGPLEWADAIGLDHVLGGAGGALRGVPRGALPPGAGAAPARRARGASDAHGGAASSTTRLSRGAEPTVEQSRGCAALTGERLTMTVRVERRERAAALPALPRRPPRGRVAVPARRRSGRARPRTASRRRSSPRCAPIRGCTRLEPARVGADDRPPQGAGRPPRPRAARAAGGGGRRGRRAARRARRRRATASCGRRCSGCPHASARRSCSATSPTSPTARSPRRSAARRRRRGARCTRDLTKLRKVVSGMRSARRGRRSSARWRAMPPTAEARARGGARRPRGA